MLWASAVADDAPIDVAVQRAAAVVAAQLGGTPPDLVVAFVSEQHRPAFGRVPEIIAAQFPPALLLGCSAGGVIGGGREVEQRPAVSLTAAVLPSVEITPFHLEADALATLVDEPAAWQPVLGVAAAKAPHFVILPEPFSFDAETFLRGLDGAFPASQKIGGLASGARQPGGNALFLGDTVHRSGCVGVALSGNVEVETVVAQGCRPIGVPMFVTGCQGNVIRELDGRPALQVLQELYEQLPASDQELARHSLFLGIVMSEHQQAYRQGDFLIRNLVGMDPERGALAVGALLRDNAIVQFHLRDAKTSAEDIEALLSRYAGVSAVARPHGALLFSCLGRGKFLYGRPDHDTDTFRRHLGEVPLGGFFCNGEIGPVHGTTFLHGYTSAFGLFRGRRT